MGGPRHPASRTPKPDIDLSGVPRSAQESVEAHVGPGADPDAGRNYGTAEQEIYNQTFSGIDYHITAVIPQKNDYDLSIGPEVRRLAGALSSLQSQIEFTQQSVRFNQQQQDPIGLAAALQELSRLTSEAASVQRAIDDQYRRQRAQVHFKTFAEIQTLSVTTRRSVHPVRRLGEKFPAYYTRGPRTIAGSLIFVQLDGDPLMDLARRTDEDAFDGEPSFLVDRLPQFNILVTGINERGHMVQSALFDVTIIAGGTTYSVDDMYTEQQHTYVARWMTPMTSVERGKSLLERFQVLPGRGAGAVSELEILTTSTQADGSLGRGGPNTSSPGRERLGSSGRVFG